MGPAPAPTPAPHDVAQSSDRVLLAAAARRAALATPGVVELPGGPLGLHSTTGGGERIDGVACVALPDGRVEVTLQVATTLTPLPELVEQLRERVVAASRVAGLADRLGPVNVVVEDIVSPEEAP